MKFKMIIFIFLSINLPAEIRIPKETSQLIIVSSSDFQQNKATLQAYEKVNNVWEKYFEPIKVNIGRNGLAWGEGIIQFKHNKYEPLKQEGDGKSPAGLFELESFFGYEDAEFSFPYLKSTKNTLCIDDINSSQYNKIIDNEHLLAFTKKTSASQTAFASLSKETSASQTAFASFEYMKRDDELYKYGVVVGHNQGRIKKKGSCIFLHISKGDNSPTAGCTSMNEDVLLKLMKWLDKSKRPLLLQLTNAYMEEGF